MKINKYSFFSTTYNLFLGFLLSNRDVVRMNYFNARSSCLIILILRKTLLTPYYRRVFQLEITRVCMKTGRRKYPYMNITVCAEDLLCIG